MQETISRRERLRREKQAKENAAKKSTMKTYVHQTPFREAERNFKSRNPPPDFSEVYDIVINPNDERLEQVELSYDLRTLTSYFGSINGDNEEVEDKPWKERSRKAYIIKDMPGLVIIPNPFTPAAERSLIQKCLSDYPQTPNTSNLHTHYDVPSTGIWSLYEKEQNGTIPMDDPKFYIQKKNKKATDDDDDDKSSDDEDKRYSDDDEEEEEEIKPSTPPPQQQQKQQLSSSCTATTACSLKNQQQQNRTLIIPLKACDDDFNPLLNQPKPEPPAASTVPLLPTSELVKRLRWITLGYHYHWPTKTYHLDRRFPVPDTVKDIVTSCVYAIENIGSNSSDDDKLHWKNTYQGKNYHPEAGVVNYYQYRDTLMGHVDRSELNMEAPLISISLGNACIYLLGGEDRNKKPAALYLRSGDIIAMTKLCRRSFHGVPRIIEDTLPDYLKAEGDYPDAPNWKLYGQYMTTSRININIRQVNPVD